MGLKKKCSCYSYNTGQLTPEHKQSSYPLLSTLIHSYPLLSTLIHSYPLLSWFFPAVFHYVATCKKHISLGAEKMMRLRNGVRICLGPSLQTPGSVMFGHVWSLSEPRVLRAGRQVRCINDKSIQKPCDAWLIGRVCVRSAEHMECRMNYGIPKHPKATRNKSFSWVYIYRSTTFLHIVATFYYIRLRFCRKDRHRPCLTQQLQFPKQPQFQW